MSLDSDDTSIPERPEDSARRKADASVVLKQLRENMVRENGVKSRSGLRFGKLTAVLSAQAKSPRAVGRLSNG